MIFLKNCAGIRSSLYYRERWFFFSRKYDHTPRQKMKDDISQKKKYTKIWYYLQMSWKDGHLKKGCAGQIVFFSRKGCIFPWAENERERERERERDDLFQEIHENIFSTQQFPRPPCLKNLKTILSRKNIPKGDWHSRSTP